MPAERRGVSIRGSALWGAIGVSWVSLHHACSALWRVLRQRMMWGIARYGALTAGLILVHEIELPRIGAAQIVAAANGRSDSRGLAPVHRSRVAPGPLDRGEPHQLALQVIAAPVREERRRRLVRHPFGDGLDAEPLGQIGQRGDEGTVVVGAHEVLHEGS